MRKQKLIEPGMPPEEARHAARRAFGDATQTKEVNREMWTFAFLETFWQDLRYGLRQLRRNPGFTAVAIITLALGIGANTAIFSLVEAALFPPFAVSNPDRLAGVYTSGPDGTGYSSTSYPDYIYYRDHNQVFSGLMAYAHLRLRWTSGDQTTFPWAAIVSSNYFNVLGVKPFVGRTFLHIEDNAAGASAVAVVSDQFWTRQLASDPNVVGRTLILNGHPFTIIGVVPKDFVGVDLAWGATPDVWFRCQCRAWCCPAAATLTYCTRAKPDFSSSWAG